MRLVCCSDIHGFESKLTIPDGDVFIYAGDFSMRAQISHVQKFSQWVNSLPHKHKIVVAGNHDIAAETMGWSWTKETFAPVIYLSHELVQVEGMSVFGSPYSSAIYTPSDWVFDYPRFGERGERLWNALLDLPQIDILVTHGPPYSIGDRVGDVHPGEDPLVGDMTLYDVVRRKQPLVHIFGHIHDGYGRHERENMLVDLNWYAKMSPCQETHNRTVFYNVSVCDVNYQPINKITVIDLP